MKWQTALEHRDDIRNFGGEAIGLFGLALRFGVDDLVSVAADAITDGTNDKKIDILFIDSSQKTAFIMQCYKANGGFESEAPANKATDLNTAVSYAFSVALDEVPEKLQPQIMALRDAVKNDVVDTIYIWYVRNRTESKNIGNELAQVEVPAQKHLTGSFPGVNCRVIAQEIGRNTLEEWYEKSSSVIIVDKDIDFAVKNYYERTGSAWKCLVTSVAGRDLYALYKEYERDLFSLNVRDYLGIIKKEANVNFNIRNTAKDEPSDFWAFNNGITAIVHDYETTDDGFKVKGIAIVNGAQTTGALGNLEEPPSEELYVPARFFKTEDSELIESIIRYNNSQNAIEASDFRSTDSVQKRLREQFARIPSADYEGGRRGNISDAIKRRPNLLPSYTVGQALTAFHGDPVLAYNEKSRIWSDNNAYNRIFNDQTTARNIILCFSLLRAIESTKQELQHNLRELGDDNISKSDTQKLEFFRQKGSQYLLLYVVSQCLEMILNRPIPNRFRLSFGDMALSECIYTWHPILNIFLSFSPKLTSYLSEELKSNERAKAAADDFRQTLEAIKQYNEAIYDSFRQKIVVD